MVRGRDQARRAVVDVSWLKERSGEVDARPVKSCPMVELEPAPWPYARVRRTF